MNQKYFIGLDGGGTKTKCIVTDYNLNPIYETQGGPSNFLIIGTEIVFQTIIDLINESKMSLNISDDEIESILLGSTGAGREEDAEMVKKGFMNFAKSLNHNFKNFNVVSDANIALEGAFSGGPGCLLIAGTGSIILGKNNENVLFRVGGFGKYIGDEGSGNSIGRKGLINVAKAYDGRGEQTLLSNILETDFNIKNSSELIKEVYINNFDLASFAPKVIEAADKGDEISRNILEDESNELILHIRSMYKLIGVQKLKLSLVGGTISNKNYYSDLFRKKVSEILPFVEIIEAENPPAIGAAYIAKSMVDNINQILS